MNAESFIPAFKMKKVAEYKHMLNKFGSNEIFNQNMNLTLNLKLLLLEEPELNPTSVVRKITSEPTEINFNDITELAEQRIKESATRTGLDL